MPGPPEDAWLPNPHADMTPPSSSPSSRAWRSRCSSASPTRACSGRSLRRAAARTPPPSCVLCPRYDGVRGLPQRQVRRRGDADAEARRGSAGTGAIGEQHRHVLCRMASAICWLQVRRPVFYTSSARSCRPALRQGGTPSPIRTASAWRCPPSLRRLLGVGQELGKLRLEDGDQCDHVPGEHGARHGVFAARRHGA